MKKNIYLLLICQLLIANCLLAQWGPDVRLTNNLDVSQTSGRNAWNVAASGNMVHVVWREFRDRNPEIYYKRSTDAGVTWGPDTRLTNNTASSAAPSVAVADSVVHVVWDEFRDGNTEIYYKRSTDAGITWGPDIRLTNNTARSLYPSVAVSGSIVHVVWRDNRAGNDDVFYKRSVDNGVTWSADIPLTTDVNFSNPPTVATLGTVVHVAWDDNRHGAPEIYYRRSTDAGVIWAHEVRLTNNPDISVNPSLAVSGSFVHLVWTDRRDGNDEVYYKRSSDGGVNWSPDTRLTLNTAPSWHPSVAALGSTVNTVWTDNRDGNHEIYFKRSLDSGLNWHPDTRLTNNIASSFSPSIAMAGQVVHVVWYDTRDGNDEVYYKRDPTSIPVGIGLLNSNSSERFFLAQNYPNPFHSRTRINMQFSEFTDARLTVHDFLGREIVTIVNKEFAPGTYELYLDGTGLSSGIYFLRLEAREPIGTGGRLMGIESRKILLIN